MKFLLAILIVKFLFNLSSCNLEPLITRLQEKKFFLPDFAKIENLDTNLLIRVSISPEGVKGSNNFNFPNYTNFEIDEFSNNFISAKLDNKIRIFKINNVILNLKKIFYKMNDFQKNSTNNEIDKNSLELLIICKKQYLLNNIPDKNKDNSLLILSVPIIIGNFKKEESADIDKYFENFSDESNEFFPLDKVFNKISHDLVYFKSTENEKINNFFIFKNELKISSSTYHNLIDKFSKTNTVNRKSQDFVEFVGSKFLDNNANEAFLNSKSENFLNKLNNNLNYSDSFNLNKLMEEVQIDPDNLVKNFYEKSSRQTTNYHLSLQDFIEYIKLKYGLTIKISEKLMINEYIARDLKPTLKNSKISTEVIKTHFDNIYEKFVKSKSEEKERAIKHPENNKIDHSNISSTNELSEDQMIITNNTKILNKSVSYSTNNNITFENTTDSGKLLDIDYKGTFDNKYKTSKNETPYSNSQNQKISDKIFSLKNNKENTIGFKPIQSDYNKTNNTFKNTTNNIQILSNNTNTNYIAESHNFENLKNTSMVLDKFMESDLITEKKYNHSNSNSSELNKSLSPHYNLTGLDISSKKNSNYTNKFDIKTPLLKNEKIKYVNGSLLVISTLMLPGKDENFRQAKEKFLKIIKNEKFI
jgi:hypothetical protein